MYKIKRTLTKFETLLFSVVHKYDTKLLEVFIATFLFIYGVLLLHNNVDTIFSYIINDNHILRVPLGIVTLLTSILAFYGLIGNGEACRKNCRKASALIAFLFFSAGTYASLVHPATALSTMLPSIFATAIIYIRLNSQG